MDTAAITFPSLCLNQTQVWTKGSDQIIFYFSTATNRHITLSKALSFHGSLFSYLEAGTWIFTYWGNFWVTTKWNSLCALHSNGFHLFLPLLFIWLHGVFIAVCRLSLVAGSGAHASLYSGFSCYRAQVRGKQASVVVGHGLSCPMSCGIFQDQGIRPLAPALSGGFLTTGPPGKSSPFLLNFLFY